MDAITIARLLGCCTVGRHANAVSCFGMDRMSELRRVESHTVAAFNPKSFNQIKFAKLLFTSDVIDFPTHTDTRRATSHAI